MDAYDSSAEYLRNKVEQVAQEITQQIQSHAPGGKVQPFFISDIVNDVEHIVNGVVNATHDAVNAVINATHNVVNATHEVINVAERVTDRAIHATEDLIDDAIAETRNLVNIAHVATEFVKVTTFVAEFAGGFSVEDAAKSSHAGAEASAGELIRVRRAAILQQRTSLINDINATRTELKSKIAAVSMKLRSAGAPRAGGQAG